MVLSVTGMIEMDENLSDGSGVFPVSVTLEIHTADERSLVMALWKRLEHRLRSTRLTCSSAWTEAWLNAYGDQVRHRFVMGYEWSAGTPTLCAVCLVTEGVDQHDGPLRLRTVHVGTSGEPECDSACIEYNELLCAPEYQTGFVLALADYLSRQHDFDQWMVDGMVDDHSLVRTVPGRLTSIRREAAHSCEFAAMRTAGHDVMTSFRSATRRKVKRSLAAYSDLSLQWGDTLDPAIDIFHEMVELHQARWQSFGKPGSYASPRFVAFHEDLLSRLVPYGRMVLVRVKSREGTVGCVQLLDDDNRALLYQCGWNCRAGASPGVVVDYMAMEACLQRGYHAYDFLAYETQHKRLLSNTSRDLVWAHCRRPALRFAALDAARRAKRWWVSQRTETPEAEPDR